MLKFILSELVRPYIRLELPGWGRLYDAVIGGYDRNSFWGAASPRIIRDKHHRYYRILDIRDWADRSLYFLGRWYDLPTALAVATILRRDETAIDVGANYGHFTLAAAAAVGSGGKVLSVEPNPVAYARLRLHIALNRLAQVSPQNIGLAENPGELILSVPRINSGEASFAAAPYDDAESVSCPVQTLDLLAGDMAVALVKIDVEGFELAVLRGGRTLLERHRPFLITEVVDRHLARAGADRANLFALLSPLGYRAYRLGLKRAGLHHVLTLAPFSEDSPDGDVIWVPEEGRSRLAGLLPEG